MLNTVQAVATPAEVLVQAQQVSKKFCRSLRKSLYYGVRDVLAEFNPFVGVEDNDRLSSSHSLNKNKRELRAEEFWAVNEVSLEIRRGECLGLIGRNGSGKTTLLKILNGLIKPDTGRVVIRGRVGGLISLGAGFSPILTGRENIYVNGSVLGLAKTEIDAKIDEIIDFAEIREHIDSPVQTYSSGMTVRLGFAVATAMDPDVLILDEVLAVGDRAFRSKCMTRVSKMLDRCAVIFVSHSAGDIQQICDRVIWLEAGRAQFYGATAPGLQAYGASAPIEVAGTINLLPPIASVAIEVAPSRVTIGDPLAIAVRVELSQSVVADYFVGAIVADTGETVAQFLAPWSTIRLSEGSNLLRFTVKNIRLAPGRYSINALCCAGGGKRVLFHFSQLGQFQCDGGAYLWSSYQPETIP